MPDIDPRQDILCPFCWDGGFDLIGLKLHLERYCTIYEETPRWSPKPPARTEKA
jgi:predicted DsbA family dithiol-disulfide isomerase